MAETFDPYRKWLGIPPSQQPPHHYRLLGVELFEEDVEVIDTAASQRMSYLQELGGGSHVKESQRLLNEVSAARRVLLDAKKKKDYDAELRGKLAASAPAASLPVTPPPVGGAPKVKRAHALSDDDSTVTINLNEELTTLRQKSSGGSKSSSGSKHASSKGAAAKSSHDKHAADGATEHKPRSRKKRNPVPLLIVLCLLIGAAGGGVFYVLQDRKPNDVAAAGNETPVNPGDVEPIAVVPKRTVAASVPVPKPTAMQSLPATSQAAPTERSETTSPPISFFPPSVPSPTAPAATATAKEPPPKAATPSGTAGPTEVASSRTPGGLPTESAPPPAVLFGLETAAAPDARAHYSPPGRTLRDLRGFFREGDDYHVFYDATETVSKKQTEVWGHAVSRDLFSWKELEKLTPPVPVEQAPQLGCVVVDRDNAAGLGKAGSPTWIAAFTYAASGDAKKGLDVGLMYSADLGQTWTAHAKNPVLKEQPATSRWPRLFRHDGSKQWGMLTYVSTVTPPVPPTPKKGAPPPPPTEPPKTTYRIFTSPDLLDWKQQHEFLYPAGAAPAELVELVDAADAAKTKWMFLQGRGRYWMGEFDGERFTTDRSGGGMQAGSGYYGFRALDGGDRKEVVLLSLVASSDSGAQTAAAMALPHRLKLQGGAVSPVRDSTPAAWNGPVKQWSNHDLDPILPVIVFEGGSLFRVQLTAQSEQASAIVVTVFGQPVKFDFAAKQYQVAGRSAAPFGTTVVQIDGIVDVDLAEFTIGGVGSVAFRTASGPDARTPLEVKAVGGKARITSLVVTPLKPAKPPAAAAPKP